MPKCSNCSKEVKKLEHYGDMLLCKECAREYSDGNSKTSKKDNWLIRTTDGHILGPYSSIRIRSLISDKKVVFLDEVSKNGAEWALIKNIALFKDLALKTDYSLNESTVDVDISTLKRRDGKPPVFKKDRKGGGRRTEEHRISKHTPPPPPKRHVPVYDEERIVVTEYKYFAKWMPIFAGAAVVVLMVFGLIYYSAKTKSTDNVFQKADTVVSGSDYFNKYYIKGRELEEGGLYKEALQQYDRALATKPDHAGVRARKAAIDMVVLGDRSTAEKELQVLYSDANIGKISDQDEQCDIKNFLGILEAKKGNYQAAYGYFNQALVMKPTSSYIYYNIGRVLFRQENYVAALDYFKNAKRLSSSFSDASLYEGSTLMRLSRFKEAYQVFSDAVVQNPNVREFYVLGAYSALKAYGSEKAYSMLKELLTIDPYHFEKVFTPLHQIDKDSSLKDEINCVVEIMRSLNENDRKEAGYILAMLYFIDSNTAAAEKLLPEGAKNTDPNGLLVSGMIAFHRDRYDEAEKDISKSLELDYSSSLAHLYAGLVALHKDDLGQARNHFTKAQSTNETTALYASTMLGDVLQRSGYKNESLVLWKKVIALDSHYVPAWERVLNIK